MEHKYWHDYIHEIQAVNREKNYVYTASYKRINYNNDEVFNTTFPLDEFEAFYDITLNERDELKNPIYIFKNFKKVRE